MNNLKFEFSAKIWLYPCNKPWHFVTLPEKISKQIKYYYGSKGGTPGMIKIIAIIKNTQWKTSLFPDKRLNSYLLPIKASTRKHEELKENDQISITIILNSSTLGLYK